jgi:hypothetical protein
MKERLGDWSCFVCLAHKTLHSRTSRRGWNQRLVLKPNSMFGSIRFDFELLHYSAGVSFRVMGDREHVRTRRICALFQKIFLLAIPKELLRTARVARNTFKYIQGIQGTDH